MTSPTTDQLRLLNTCRVRLPGAIDAQILLEMFYACDEFFRDSNCWTQDITYAVEPTVTTYDLSGDITIGLPNRLMYTVDGNGFARAVTMALPGTVTLMTSINVNDTWLSRIALTCYDPEDDNNFPVFPAWIAAKYADTLLDGTLWRMMSQPKKPYTDAKTGEYHRARFRRGVMMARREAARLNTYRAQAWLFPQNFQRTLTGRQ